MCSLYDIYTYTHEHGYNIPYQCPIITFLLASCDMTTNEESADKVKEEMAFGGSLLYHPPRTFGYSILYTCALVFAVFLSSGFPLYMYLLYRPLYN